MVTWTEQEEGAYWECDNCMLGWFFTSGTPADNDTHYCPKCGYEITEFIFEGREEE